MSWNDYIKDRIAASEELNYTYNESLEAPGTREICTTPLVHKNLVELAKTSRDLRWDKLFRKRSG